MTRNLLAKQAITRPAGHDCRVIAMKVRVKGAYALANTDDEMHTAPAMSTRPSATTIPTPSTAQAPLRSAAPASPVVLSAPAPVASGQRATVPSAPAAAHELSPEGRRERHRRETFERLVRAARSIMFNRGLNDVTVQDITEAADVGKGTFFNYFPSKEHVFTRVSEFNRRGMQRTLERIRSGERSAVDAMADYLTWIMCPQVGDWLTYETNLVRALATQPDVRRSFSEQVRASLPLYEEMMTISQQGGTTRKDLSGTDLAAMTHLFFAGAQILHWIHSVPPTPDITSSLVKTYFTLLAPPPQPVTAAAEPAPRKARTAPRPRSRAPRKASAPKAASGRTRTGATQSGTRARGQARTSTGASRTQKRTSKRRRS